ncbi:MFS transporter [Sporolactobacillus sp. CQH2019]|uniref:MFS transporter n=1 Tax=Sporolactobacillus sp. CQH2019 TaxID=3023512 RepID=UPI00236754D6|nr:MFS transporter [Sporolactobacillus sp. CQH2019]MDD9149940.1 MFS transporter [Sporolactobacillus sp. CQH2019]
MKKIPLLFFTTTFIIGTDTFLISPLLPVLSHIYHTPSNLAGWMVSAYALGYALFALIAGPLSDGMDRKKVMIFGLSGFTLATFLCAVSPSFPTMILFRFLAGISAAFVTPQIWAAIPQLVAPKSIIKTMGVATAGLSVSQMIGLPAGSYLAVFSWRAPFLALSFSALLLNFAIGSLLPSLSTVRTNRNRHIDRIYNSVMKAPHVFNYFAGYFMFQTGFFTSYAFLGIWFTQDFSLNVASIGTNMILLGLGNLIGSLFGSRLVARAGVAKSVLFSLIFLSITYVLLPLSGSLWIAEGLFLLIFLVGGFIFPVLMSTLQSLAPSARGTISALASAVMYAGTTVGGVIGGFLFDWFHGFIGIGLFAAAMNVIPLLFFQRAGLFHDKKEKGMRR